MNPLFFHISAIKRPRLLMDAAKALLLSRKTQGRQIVSDEAIIELINQEQECENQRRGKAVEYQVDTHVALLASLIEQASYYSKKAS